MSLRRGALMIANYRRVDPRHPRVQSRCIHSCDIFASIPVRGLHLATKWSVSCAMLMGLRSTHEVARHCAGETAPRAPIATVRPGECTAPVRHVRAVVLWIALIAMLLSGISPATAQAQDLGHFGRNRLRFSAVEPFLLPDATGTGIVDYKGGKEPSSQWRASFRFSGLEPGASYTVVIRGRFGAPRSPEATAFSPLCSFAADVQGQGGCFWYFRGLARLNLVQLRAGSENGTPVLEANRSRGPGSIETDPNRFSPGGENPPRERSRGR
jgi:hypothetical protein